jgi:peroxiredoxin
MSNTELEVGSPVPDFKLPANTAGEIAPSDYRGKKVVLFFVREFI